MSGRSPFGPADWFRLSMNFWRMAAEAQWVIALRVAGMAGFWPSNPHETTVMVTEKMRASRDSAIAAASAVMCGAAPAEVAAKALKPYAQRTRSNARRLSLTPKRRG